MLRKRIPLNGFVRSRSTTAVIQDSIQNSAKGSTQDSTKISIKDYNSIPGPSPLPVIGNLWRYFPVVGDYRMDALHLNAFKNQQQYGDLVRESIIGEHSILHVFDPADIRTVLKSIGRYPQRRSHRALMKYRLDRPSKYNSGGLFPENGLPWQTLRGKLQRLFMNARNMKQYVLPCNEITNELIDFVDHNLDDKLEIDDFQTALFRWSLENTAVLAMDLKLGALKHELSDELQLLIKSTHDTHAAVIETETGSDLWKVVRTKSYRKLETAQDNMYQILAGFFERKISNDQGIEHAKWLGRNSVFNQLLNESDLDEKDLFMTIMDLFLAGLDTTSFIGGFALYFLTQNPSAQSKLREEIGLLLDETDGQFNEKHLNSIPFLKACVKETMRLQPVSIGIGRVTDKELVLRGYRVPEGTMVILHNQVACRLATNFNEPDRFWPERWLAADKSGGLSGGLQSNDGLNDSNKNDAESMKNPGDEGLSGTIEENWLSESSESRSKGSMAQCPNQIDPFLVLPFGFGRRVCLGRAFSEMEIYVLLAKLIHNYEITYEHEKIGTLTRLINVPDKPMRFKFTKIQK